MGGLGDGIMHTPDRNFRGLNIEDEKIFDIRAPKLSWLVAQLAPKSKNLIFTCVYRPTDL